MTFKRKKFGIEGEELASRFLKGKGYRILERNFKNSLGEIDIIAKSGSTFCFIEVKSRTSDAFGEPAEAVSRNKQRKLSQVALSYLKANRLTESDARFDIVSVMRKGNDAKIEVFENAFELNSPYMY